MGTTKRVIWDAVKHNGELDTFTLVKGLLTLRNTPDQMLPATIVPVQPPQMTRVSARSNKGQTTRYNDFVQQINLKSGNYAIDGIRLFRLEETNNMSSTSCTNQQQNTQLAWSPDAAYAQQLNGEGLYW